MRPNPATALALAVPLTIGACHKGPPRPVYISVEKGGKVTFSNNVPPELKAEILRDAKVTK